MTVKAKFYVSERKESATEGSPGPGVEIKLTAVTKSDGNGDWSKWTPTGSITMYVTNPGASDQLRLGAKFYVTFEEADE